MLTLALYFPCSLAITLLQDSISLEFGDQGRKLLVGFAVAVVAVIAFTIIKFQTARQEPAQSLHFRHFLHGGRRYKEAANRLDSWGSGLFCRPELFDHWIKFAMKAWLEFEAPIEIFICRLRFTSLQSHQSAQKIGAAKVGI